MNNPWRAIALPLASALLLAAVTACGTATPTPTAAPAKPAAAPAAPAAATTAPAPAAAQPASSSEILIGMNVPITGPSADQGALQVKAIRLAEKTVNAAGGVNGAKIKVIPEDNQSTNTGALAALDKSVESDKVLTVIGPIMSTQIQAMSDAVKKYGVPWATGGTAVKNTHMDNPWIFRMRPDDSIAAAAMVKYIKEDMKLTKVGVLHDSDAFGSAGADLVEQYSKDAGISVVKREKYTANDKDYAAQLLSLKAGGAEVMIVYAARPGDVAIIQRQYRQLGLPYKYMGSPSSAAVDTIALSKESSEGLNAVVDFVPGTTDAAKKYGDTYQTEYKDKMDPLSAWYYDAVILYADIIKKVGTDRAKIRDAVLATKGWQGVCGSYSFTSNGDGLRENSVIEIQKGGDYKLLKVVQVSQ